MGEIENNNRSNGEDETIVQISLKTIGPSPPARLNVASRIKIEIKRVLESLYGFEVEKVRTLNREGKKKKRGGLLVAKPEYKKAYVTLRSPLSMSQDLYPIRIIEEDRRSMIKETKSKSSIVEKGEAWSHWLDKKDAGRFKPEKNSGSSSRGRNCRGDGGDGAAKFPWSNMQSSRLPLALIFCLKQCILKIEQFACSFGTLPGKRDLGVLFQATLEILPLQ